MNSALILAVVMLVGVLVAFAVIHSLTRRIPFEQTVPRERFRWPVWNWYPMVVIAGLAVTLSFAIYYAATRTSSSDTLSAADEYDAERSDFELVAGRESGLKATPKTTGTAGSMTTGTAGKMTETKKKK